MSQEHRELWETAATLASAAGCVRPVGLEQLAGGKNNRVYRVDFADGGRAVLKSYFSDPRDTRDRLAAEWNFLQHAVKRRVNATPKPLASDPEARAALYSFVEGRKLESAEIGAREVDQALAFVLAINAPPSGPLELSAGSEACFSLEQHLETVERRVGRLVRLDGSVPHRQEAEAFVRNRLAPAWAKVRHTIEARIEGSGASFAEALGSQAVCASPSDFGFHNALTDGQGRLTFLDFEYAGRDDPAKLVSDFFCQPEIPVPLVHYGRFLDGLADGLGLTNKDADRCRLLLDAYRIKWTCIILNDFLPVGATRRAFADQGAWEDRCRYQLARAAAKIDEIGTN